MRAARWRAILAGGFALISLPAGAADIWSGIYSADQARDGRAIYLTHCAAACHVENLMGNGPTPGLAGPDFLLRWEDFSLAELLDKIRATMPKAAPGSLSEAEYVATIAYVLAANGFPAGMAALTAERGQLGKIVIAARK